MKKLIYILLLALPGLFAASAGYGNVPPGFKGEPSSRLNVGAVVVKTHSLSKMFTHAVIVQLADEGKIKLTDAVNKYLPKFPYGDKITIHHLLHHTSGISGTVLANCANTAQMVESFKSEALSFAPGSRFEYNSFNFIVLACIAEKVTGTPYPQLVKMQGFDKSMDYTNQKIKAVTRGLL